MAAPQGNDRYLTDLDVRIWLRDNDPAANLLIADYEFTPEEIRSAQTLAADYWNEMPPYIGAFDYTRNPFRFHMLMGTSANLLFMAAMRFRRNSLKYSAGGLNVADQEKFNEYDAAGQRMWDLYKNWVAVNKRTLNAERGYGIVG